MRHHTNQGRSDIRNLAWVQDDREGWLMDCDNAVLLCKDKVYRVRSYEDLTLDQHSRVVAVFVNLLDAQAYVAQLNGQDWHN